MQPQTFSYNQFIDHDIIMRRGQWLLRCNKTNYETYNPAYVNNRVCPNCGRLTQLPQPESNQNSEPIPYDPPLVTTIFCEICKERMELTDPTSQIYYCKNGHRKALVNVIDVKSNTENKDAKHPEKKKRSVNLTCPFCNKVAIVEDESKVFGKLRRRYSCGHTELLDILTPPADRDNRWNDLYEFQRSGVEFVENANYQAMIGDEMGLGKALPLNSLISTPCGLKRNGDLQIGDNVCTPDGGIAKIDGIYPQGTRQLFKVTFTDGTSTECDIEHLWNVQTPNWKFRKGSNYFETLTLRKIIESGLSIGNGNLKFYIPITKPVQMCEKSLPIDPYLMGALLGDGSFCQNSIRMAATEPEIINEFDQHYELTPLPDGFALTKLGLTKIISDLKLRDCRANTKFIPEIYLWNSIPNRIAILQGLMDTDGWISSDGKIIQYTTISEQLKDGVKFLVQSLGGIAYESTKIPIYSYKGEKFNGQLAYTLTINLPNEIVPFRLGRKVIKCKPKHKYLPNRGIKSIEYIRDEECQCIHIDHPDHLYMTNDFIVTHNTIQSLAVLRYNYDEMTPCLMIPEASKVYDWQEEFNDWVGDKFDHPQDSAIIHNSGKFGLCPGFKNHIVPMSLLSKDKVLKSILDYGFKFMIVDESHSFKNVNADRTYALQQIAKVIPHKLFLSGTPVMNNVMEYFVPLNILRPSHFPSKDYLANICEKAPNGRILGIKEYRRPKFFHQISEYIIRRSKKDAGIKLPNFRRNYQSVAIEHNKEFVKKYNDLVDELQKIIDKKRQGVIDPTRMNDLLGIFARMRHIVGLSKVEPVIQYVEEFLESTDSDDKITIGVHHQLVMEYLAKGLKEHNPICISDESPEIKMQRIEKFRSNGQRVLIASILGCGQGLNIQFCKNAIIAEREWNPAKEEQFMGRFHRIVKNPDGTLKTEFDDAKDSVNIDFLNVKDTIDEFMDRLVELKSHIVGSTLEESNFVSSEFLMELAEMVTSARLKMRF